MPEKIYERLFRETEGIMKDHDVDILYHVQTVINESLSGENKNKMIEILKSEGINDIDAIVACINKAIPDVKRKYIYNMIKEAGIDYKSFGNNSPQFPDISKNSTQEQNTNSVKWAIRIIDEDKGGHVAIFVDSGSSPKIINNLIRQLERYGFGSSIYTTMNGTGNLRHLRTNIEYSKQKVKEIVEAILEISKNNNYGIKRSDIKVDADFQSEDTTSNPSTEKPENKSEYQANEIATKNSTQEQNTNSVKWAIRIFKRGSTEAGKTCIWVDSGPSPQIINSLISQLDYGSASIHTTLCRNGGSDHLNTDMDYTEQSVKKFVEEILEISKNNDYGIKKSDIKIDSGFQSEDTPSNPSTEKPKAQSEDQTEEKRKKFEEEKSKLQKELQRHIGIKNQIECHNIYKSEFFSNAKKLCEAISNGDFEKVKKYSSINVSENLLPIELAIRGLNVQKWDKNENSVKIAAKSLQVKFDELNKFVIECENKLAELK